MPQADRAHQPLPDKVDTEQHQGLLEQFGLNTETITQHLPSELKNVCRRSLPIQGLYGQFKLKKESLMTKMSDPRELFVHELGDLLYAENVLVKALPKLAKEATDAELRQGFESHLEETRQHVANLEQVFEKIGQKAKAEKCPGIEGIKAEHDEFMKEEKPSPQVCDLFLTGAGARAEHYEIAAYTGLIGMAESIGESEAVPLLQQNLKQEKAALAKLETTAKRMLSAHAAVAS